MPRGEISLITRFFIMCTLCTLGEFRIKPRGLSSLEITTITASLAQQEIHEVIQLHQRHNQRLKEIEDTLIELLKEKDAIIKSEVENYVLIKIPLKPFRFDNDTNSNTKVQIGTHKYKRDARGKRFITEAIAGISAFVVESGLWSVFEVACSSFLEFTGSVILDEIISLFNVKAKHEQEHDIWRRDVFGSRKNNEFDVIQHSGKIGAQLDFLFSEESNKDSYTVSKLNNAEFANGCDSIVDCASEDDSARLEAYQHSSALPSSICMWDNSSHAGVPIKLFANKIKYFDHKVKKIETPKRKVGTAKYKRYCYFDEVLCVIPYEHFIDTRFPTVIGCGGCAAVELRMNWIEVTINNIEDGLKCRSLTDNVRQWRTWDKEDDLAYVQKLFPNMPVVFATTFKMFNIDYAPAD